MRTKIEINTDREHLDIDFIHEFISNSYWGTGRTLKTVQTCIQNSLNFGVYLNNQQIGYGRVVTDYGQFAYIMDVFITPKHRGQGYSKELMQYIMSFDKLSNVKVWRLSTDDAQGLYQQFGFLPLEKPENSMAFFK
jgi:GNAT superfamily N-acetyltransferase